MKRRLLDVIEQDFVERIAYVPMSEAKAISHIHRVADVLSEDYMYAHNGDEGGDPQAVARLRFRAARKHVRDLSALLDKYAGFTPLSS